MTNNDEEKELVDKIAYQLACLLVEAIDEKKLLEINLKENNEQRNTKN